MPRWIPSLNKRVFHLLLGESSVLHWTPDAYQGDILYEKNLFLSIRPRHFWQDVHTTRCNKQAEQSQQWHYFWGFAYQVDCRWGHLCYSCYCVSPCEYGWVLSSSLSRDSHQAALKKQVEGHRVSPWEVYSVIRKLRHACVGKKEKTKRWKGWGNTF